MYHLRWDCLTSLSNRGRLWAVSGVILVLILCFIFSYGSKSLAQENPCGDFLDILRLATSEQICRALNNNWACYGSMDSQAYPVSVQFDRPRDRLPVLEFETIQTTAPNGIVLMRLQTTGEPVNIVLFGDMEVEREEEQRFTMRLDSGNLLCENTPAGLVARTQKGETGLITVNGVEIELGSTVFATLEGSTSMVVANIEGAVTVRLPRSGMQRVLAPGEQVRVFFIEDLPTSVGEPEPSVFARSAAFQWLASEESGFAQVGEGASSQLPPFTPTPTVVPNNDDSNEPGDDVGPPVPRPTRRIRDHLPLPRPSQFPTVRPTQTPTQEPTSVGTPIATATPTQRSTSVGTATPTPTSLPTLTVTPTRTLDSKSGPFEPDAERPNVSRSRYRRPLR